MEKGKLIGQGRTAEVYDYGSGYILKLYREGMPEQAVINEYNISNYAHKAGLSTPVAKEIVMIEGRKGIVFERIDGESMLKSIFTKPWRIKKYASEMAEIHYKLHKIKFNVPDAPKQKEMLINNIKDCKELSEEKKSVILEYLNRLETDNSMCHGDFHPDNILILGDKYLVIDWMTGSSGSYLCDVARTCLLISKGTLPPGTSVIKRKLMDGFRNKLYTEYLKTYLKISGVSRKEVDKWMLPIAAARLVEWLPPYEKDLLLKIIDEQISNIELI